MSEKELSDVLYSITGIKKSFFESYVDHITRCYEEMVSQITTLKKGMFETLNHFIVRALKEYAVKSGFVKKKFLESDSSYELRNYQYLQSIYNTDNCQELLIKLYSDKSSWASYSSKARVKANSRFQTLEVTYQGQTRIVEIIEAGSIRSGDVIRRHCDNYDRYKFATVQVSNPYYDAAGELHVNILEDGEWYKMDITAKFQRMIY